MDNKEAMYWLAIIQQAKKGEQEAMEILRQEDEVRISMGQKPIKEELKEILEEAEVNKAVEAAKKRLQQKTHI